MFNESRKLVEKVYMDNNRQDDAGRTWDVSDVDFATTVWGERQTIPSLLTLAREIDVERNQDILFDKIVNEIAEAFLFLVRGRHLSEDILIDRVATMLLVMSLQMVSSQLVHELVKDIEKEFFPDSNSKIDMHA